MNISQAEQFLLSLASLPRAEYMKDPSSGRYLERIQFLLDLLGNPEKKIPHAIHITGTSGKGSVTTMMQSILTAAGHKTGMLQSPHPHKITERWVIGDTHMSDETFILLIQKISTALDIFIQKTDLDVPSYHEMLTIIGLLYFSQEKCEWIVLEAGCGARYDATNILPNKEIAMITNIGLDHIGLIGNNKAEIAYEKAGIVLHAAHLFSSEKDPEMQAIILQEGKKEGTPVTFIQDAGEISSQSWDHLTFTYKENTYRLPLSGAHQMTNAILCIEAAAHLGIPLAHIQQGLAVMKQPLRFELCSKEPLMIIDGAHNEDKIKSTVQTMQTLLREKKRQGKLHVIFGCADDKEKITMLKDIALLDLASITMTRYTNNPFRKVADPRVLQQEWKNISSVNATISLDPTACAKKIRQQMDEHDILLVTGSIFLAAEIKEQLFDHQS